ncbi:Basal-body rod modification protein FlgD [Pirellulimonas nuda]|uniref:Basal-body rod modification protein FlgD n=1 Tax=Pirellulimonas nuda TaxID=2528009 RepID=A0A518D9X0_9BACT|nr:flagellar hook capping FlgD N-terminal domain-containing protein [Pirellulimonas nuda]QDU88228.1 Basal-body rod modification protein FlgD [Pirellulimonas nuda]
MSQIPALQDRIASQQSKSGAGAANAIGNLNLDAFFDLMIAELQNQDPLNPLENDQLLAQINQIRQVGATDKLTETLDSVLLGQNITSATGLIGKQVEALSDDNQRINGDVLRVSIEDGEPKLHIELPSSVAPSTADGEVGAGEYEYLAVWDTDRGPIGQKIGTLRTTGQSGTDTAVDLRNLPATDGPKRIYRTKGDGSGQFYLAGQIPDGSQASFTDRSSNDGLSTALGVVPPLVTQSRQYTVKLSNLSEVYTK